MKRVAVIGCGALGTVFLRLLSSLEGYALSGVLAGTYAHAEAAARPYGARAYASIEELLSDAPDIVVELAGIGAVRAYAEQLLENGIETVIASVGALADEAFRATLAAAALGGGTRLHVLSGAVGGFDMLRTMALAGETHVRIVNEKAPASLIGASYLEGQAPDPDAEALLFRGSVPEAISGFPKNVNVAVASALAGGSPELAEVEILSVPGLTENRHRVIAGNRMARVELDFRSLPDPENSRSSTITAYSAAALLKELAAPIRYF